MLSALARSLHVQFEQCILDQNPWVSMSMCLKKWRSDGQDGLLDDELALYHANRKIRFVLGTIPTSAAAVPAGHS